MLTFVKKKVIFLGLIISLIFLVVAGYFLFKELKTSTRLNNFHSLTKEDPLFYSPFLDSEAFRATLERLKEAEKRLKEVSIENYVRDKDPETTETSYYIETLREVTFFPYRFLEGLISINQETDKFLENPSTKKGYHLLTLYAEAADSYLQEISGLINVIEAIEEEQRRKPILFIDSQTNLDIILVDYQIIRKNAYTLKEEIDQRKKCLEGGTDCSKLKKEHNIDYFIQFLKESLPSPLLEELKPEAELVKDAPLITFPGKEVRGPYKIESICWEDPDNSHWMYLIHDKLGDIPFVVFKLAEQNYYAKIRIPPQHKLEEAVAEKGLGFMAVSDTHHYRCNNLTFYPALLTLDLLNEETEKRGIDLEQLIEESKYRLLVENQFGLLPLTMNQISFALNFQTQQFAMEKKAVSPLHYLYGGQSAYSLFYLPYARSVWRLDEKLQYLSPETEKISIAEVDKRFYNLTELKDMGYSEEEISEFHVDLLELLDSLLNQDRF